VIKINYTIREELHQVKKIMEVQRNVSIIMRNLEFSALRLQQRLIQLHEGIDVSSSGRLSSVLVPPHNLSALLQQIVLKLPRDVSFLTGTEVDYMNVYYSVAKVQAYSTAGSIQLVVRIPLRGADEVMTLY
jgi:hypothetical protein